MKRHITFAVAASVQTVTTKPDGAIILMGRPCRSGDFDYFGFEVPDAESRGHRWDTRLTGRILPAMLPDIAAQMKGLPITDDHWFVPVGERGEYAIGTVLTDGEVDGEWISAEHLVHEPKAILKINQNKAVELSIGANCTFRWSNGGDGEPDFYIEDVVLDHVALVEEGRAGPDGRLLNHKAKLKQEQSMKTITINGQTFQVDDAVEAEFKRLSSAETDLGGQLTNARAQLTTAEQAAATITAERDTARGQLAVANAEVATIRNSQPNVAAEAVKIANAHSTFVSEAERMGHTDALTLGNYDEKAIKVALLNKRGVALAADASAETVNGAWLSALALNDADTSNTSLVDQPLKHGGNQPALPPADRAYDAVHGSYFGSPKPKATEGSAK